MVVSGELVKTCLRRLVRSRGAMIALLIGPLLLMVVAAMAFDSANTYGLHIGTYSSHYSRDANQFIDNIDAKGFQVTRFSKVSQCTDELKMGTIVSCMVFTKDPDDEVAMYVDYSKIHLVDTFLGVMGQQLSEQSRISGANITANLLQRMEDARAGLDESRPIIVSLTTHNEKSTRKVNDMLTALNALDLKIEQQLEQTSLESEDNKFIDWLQSLSSMVRDMVAQYSVTMDLVREELDSSAISEGDRQSIINRIQEGEDALDDLKGQLDIAGKVSEKDLDNVLALTQETLTTLQSIQAELDTLQGFKKQSVEKLRGIREALDSNLLKFIQLQSALNKIDSSISSDQLQNPQNLLSPLKVRVEPITTSTKRFELLFPTLLMMVILFSAVMISSSMMVMQIESPTKRRNRISPVSKASFAAAALISCLIVVGVQIALVLGVGLAFFGMDLLVVLPSTIMISMIAATTFASAGLVIGAFFATETTALFAAVMGSSALLVFSDLILPLEAFPSMVKSILLYNPLVVGTFALKRVVLFHSPWIMVSKEIMVLVTYALIGVLVLAVLLYNKKQYKFRSIYHRR